MEKKVKTVLTSVLVIGSGAGGLRAAIEAFECGADVLIVGKSSFGNAHTKLAAGGINAALGSVEPKDNWRVHATDTFVEGGNIGNPKMIEVLAKKAPRAILELASLGVKFERTKNNEIEQKVYGAQTYPRTCYVGDYTGRAILSALIGKAKKLGIRQVEKFYVTNLLKKGKKITGVFGVDFKKGEFTVIFAKAVILAMGGHSRLYCNSSSRGFEGTGCGSFLALKNGLPLVDMEMIQFHPTGMTAPKGARGKLVTEAVRSEGGMLFNAKNERFMKKYGPKKLELSARDVVARAIVKEVLAGCGTKNRGVWLDLSHIPKKRILKRLPDTFKQFKRLQGLDISRQRMEVSPTAHYSMGGIVVGPADCSTNIKGLFACGEVSGGLHGGNRLGGNSLAETIVFGKIAGKNAVQFAKQNKITGFDSKQIANYKKEVEKIFVGGTIKPQKLRSELQKIMWECAGVIRNGKKIKEGLKKLVELESSLKQMKVKSGLKKNSDLIVALDTISLVNVAQTILQSALLRKESRAAHYRTDFLKTSKNWEANIFCQKKGGSVKLWKKKILKSSPEFERAIHKNHC